MNFYSHTPRIFVSYKAADTINILTPNGQYRIIWLINDTNNRRKNGKKHGIVRSRGF